MNSTFIFSPITGCVEGYPSTSIHSAGFAGARRKILKNRLRFGKNFSFLSDFLPVRLAAQENLLTRMKTCKADFHSPITGCIEGSPFDFNPQGWLCRPEERSHRFLYQFLAVKSGDLSPILQEIDATE